MVHLILTGATGLIGSSIISHILSLPGGVVTTSRTNTTQTISKLTVLTRSATIPLLSSSPPPGTPRNNTTTEIEVLVHNDFMKYDSELLAKLRGADACIWSLGVSQNHVDAAQYVRVTKDYAVEAAKAFSTLRGASASKPSLSKQEPSAADGNSADGDAHKFKFIYISGEGATLTPRFYTPPFGRVKGEAEQALLRLSQQATYKDTLAAYSARPAGVDGRGQPWLWADVMREKRTLFQRFVINTLMPPIALLWKSWHSPTDSLARVLVDMAVEPSRDAYPEGPGISGEGRTLGNVALRRLDGLD